MTNLEKYLYQLRRIADHREKKAEKEIRKIYKELLKELNGFLGNIYATYSEDDMLNYADLAKAGMDARFLEEVEQHINSISPKVSKQIQETVQQTYEECYNGMRNAVVKAAGNRELLQQAFATVQACTPEVIRAAVNNPVSGLTLKDTLEKHRKEIIYDIKKNIGVGLTNGDRFSTMAKRIAESLDGDYTKAVRIVRTEAHRVRETGFNDAATAIDETLKKGTSGYVMAKTWHTMQDERVRPQKQKRKKYNHVKMDGVTIPQNELFKLPSGATCKAPSQTGVAGEDINCRCYLSYDLVLASELTKVQDGEKTIEEAAKVETLPDFTDGIKNAKTVQEVNQIATAHFKNKEGCKIEYVSFEHTDLRAAKDMVMKLDDLDNRFESSLVSVKTRHLNASYSGMCTPTNDSFDKYLSSSNASDLKSDIVLNYDYLRTKKAIENDFKKNNRPNYGGNVAHNAMVNEKYASIATLVHEYGHSILAGKANEILLEEGGNNPVFMGVRRQYRMYMRKLQSLNREIQEVRFQYAGQPDGLRKGIEAAAELQAQYDELCVSKYSKESVGEFIAECFCDAELSDNPKSISIQVHNALVKAFGKAGKQ